MKKNSKSKNDIATKGSIRDNPEYISSLKEINQGMEGALLQARRLFARSRVLTRGLISRAEEHTKH